MTHGFVPPSQEVQAQQKKAWSELQEGIHGMIDSVKVMLHEAAEHHPGDVEGMMAHLIGNMEDDVHLYILTGQQKASIMLLNLITMACFTIAQQEGFDV